MSNNDFLNLGITSSSDNRIENEYGRKYDVSPVFPFNNSALASGEYALIDFAEDKPAMKKYLPMNSVRVVNASSENITVYVNQKRDRGLFIPANTIQNIPADIFPSINSLLYKNEGSGTISQNQINFLISKDKVTTDILAKKIFRLLKTGDE